MFTDTERKMKCQIHIYCKYLLRNINNIIHLTIFGMQCMYKFFPDCIFIENMPLISVYLKTFINIENNHSLWESFGSLG